MTTWEDVWEKLPSQVRLELEPVAASATESTPTASLFDETLSPNEKKVFVLLCADEMTHIDELMEKLAPMSSSEVFAALFELELASKIRQLPGKHYVRTF